MWSRYAVFLLLMVLALGCATTPPAGFAPPVPMYPTSFADPSPAYQTSNEIDVQVFYQELTPYGPWVWLEDYGRVWYPHGVPSGWRPYTVGRWVYTDVGWTWVSDWEWGWAPFHYGRWVPSHRYGWVWVPGTVWAPAWVVWHHGPGWVGWAPLPPAAVWGPHGQLHITYIERHIHPSSYCFVRERHLASAHVHQHIVPSAENTRLVQVTRNVTNYTTINKQVVNQSIHVENIEKASKQPVPRLRLVDADSSQELPKERVKEKEGQVRVFRPTIARTTPDADRPRSTPSSLPGVAPQPEPLTRPAVTAPAPGTTPTSPPTVQDREPPARPGAPAATAPPTSPVPPQEERQRRPGGQPAVLSQPAPAASPPVSLPGNSQPADEPQKQRDRSRARQPQPQGQQDNVPATAHPSRPLTAPPVSAPQGTTVTVPARQVPIPGSPSQPAATRKEHRGKKPLQGQQDQDKDTAAQGNTTVAPTGLPMGTGPNLPPSPGTPGAASGNPWQRPAGSRAR